MKQDSQPEGGPYFSPRKRDEKMVTNTFAATNRKKSEINDECKRWWWDGLNYRGGYLVGSRGNHLLDGVCVARDASTRETG